MVLVALGRFVGDIKHEKGHSRKVSFEEEVKNADQEASSNSGQGRM